MELGENMHICMRYLFLQEFQVTLRLQITPGPILKASTMMMVCQYMVFGNLRMPMRHGSRMVILILWVSSSKLKMILVYGKLIAFQKKNLLMILAVATSG